jgi:hypothetical protein
MRSWSFALVLLVVVACKPTPYQRLGAEGGYSDKRLAPGRYLVRVRVNQHTSHAKLLEYFDRRASELCPRGWDIAEGLTGKSRDDASDHEIDAVIACRATGFVCSSSPSDASVGICMRSAERCRDEQQALAAAGKDMGPCVDLAAALCFRATQTASGKQQSFCAPGTRSCDAIRDAKLAAPDAWSGVGPCEDRR